MHKLKEHVEALTNEFEAEKAANRRNLLEFASLGEKMRRTYLRLSRIVKIDSEETSEENQQKAPKSSREIRDSIEKLM